VSVIILSAKASETDRIIGLEIGADDYVMKPFSVKELASRVKAVLRRAAAPETGPKVFACKGLVIDFDSVSVKLNGKPVHLSPYEFKILGFLALHPGRAWSREELLSNVWKDDAFVQPRTIDVHIRRLRTLIEKDAKNPFYIQTVRGFGYIFGVEQ
ncbi:MAG: response regulator transcription factor, partial [Candidatus Nitrosotenuis sp.]